LEKLDHGGGKTSLYGIYLEYEEKLLLLAVLLVCFAILQDFTLLGIWIGRMLEL
jgi:hypothetical protein